MVLFHQGGLLSIRSPHRVVSPHGALSSACSFTRVVFDQLGLLNRVASVRSPHCALSSWCSFMRVVFHQLGLSSW